MNRSARVSLNQNHIFRYELDGPKSSYITGTCTLRDPSEERFMSHISIIAEEMRFMIEYQFEYLIE